MTNKEKQLKKFWEKFLNKLSTNEKYDWIMFFEDMKKSIKK